MQLIVVLMLSWTYLSPGSCQSPRSDACFIPHFFSPRMHYVPQILAECQETRICSGSCDKFSYSEWRLHLAAELVRGLQSPRAPAVVWNDGELSLQPPWVEQEQQRLHTKWEDILLRTHWPAHTIIKTMFYHKHSKNKIISICYWHLRNKKHC